MSTSQRKKIVMSTWGYASPRTPVIDDLGADSLDTVEPAWHSESPAADPG
jgi:acyl carrier protein